MISTLDKSTIELFLKTAKKEIERGNTIFVGYRSVQSNGKKVNAIQALLDIGITKKEEIWKYIKKLEISNCIKIDRDKDKKRDFNSEIFIFKKEINKKIVYIKLTLNTRGLLCLSFHLDNGGNEYGKI